LLGRNILGHDQSALHVASSFLYQTHHLSLRGFTSIRQKKERWPSTNGALDAERSIPRHHDKEICTESAETQAVSPHPPPPPPPRAPVLDCKLCCRTWTRVPPRKTTISRPLSWKTFASVLHVRGRHPSHFYKQAGKMLSVSSLLNPSSPGPLPAPRFLPSPAMSSPGSCYADRPSPPYLDCPVIPKLKMSKDPVPMSKYKPRGVIKYYPFESVDELSRREVMRFRVTPFGRIQESCAHIPYNSGKKDFFEKTGRESFEVFKYEFKVPGEDNEFTVMWDYNVGLVRMTPFFKCCKYSKTVPAKMLSLNPGLKDITHSITGGAIAAQGYWMPYECAKAVCATFCYNIAGALIPIFGPSFPSMCIPPGSPDYGRMAIDHRIVEDAIREADLSRKVQHHGFPSVGLNHLPSIDHRPMRPLRDDRRLRLNTRLMSPYSDTDGDARSCPDSASSNGSDSVSYSYGFHP
ncbi:unnamed protein product, partial [Colletotrichum noveboracense]